MRGDAGCLKCLPTRAVHNNRATIWFCVIDIIVDVELCERVWIISLLLINKQLEGKKYMMAVSVFYGIWWFIISFLVVRSLTCESNNLQCYSDSVQSQYLQPINTLNLQTNVDNLFSGKLPQSKPTISSRHFKKNQQCSAGVSESGTWISFIEPLCSCHVS